MEYATAEEYYDLGTNDAAEFEQDQNMLAEQISSMQVEGVPQDRINAYIKGFEIGCIVADMSSWEQSDLVEAFAEILPEVNAEFLKAWRKRQKGC